MMVEKKGKMEKNNPIKDLDSEIYLVLHNRVEGDVGLKIILVPTGRAGKCHV